LRLLYFRDPALETAYREQKFQETRFLAVLVGFAASALAVGLWAWDWVIDPETAGAVFGTRLLLGLILALYPLAMLAGLRRDRAPWVYAAVVLATEGLFLHHLSLLESGLVYGISGFMYWFILPVFLGLPFSVSVNAACFVCIALLPDLLVPLGVSPRFELIKYNALIWRTCAIGIFLTLLLDQLYRRIFVYRRKTEELARVDDLTGIANRRHFMEISSRLLETCRRSEMPVSVVMLDVDHFKRINDRHGHLAGDAVLRHVAGLLSGCLRRSDVLGRYGGEEFAVILPHTPPDKAFRVAEKIREKVRDNPVRIHDGAVIHVTLSAGVLGVESAAGFPLEQLMKRADDALYEAKRSGRNRVFLAGMQPGVADPVPWTQA
jgi:diguanylate cyclase (GGDEF)-like protein